MEDKTYSFMNNFNGSESDLSADLQKTHKIYGMENQLEMPERGRKSSKKRVKSYGIYPKTYGFFNQIEKRTIMVSGKKGD